MQRWFFGFAKLFCSSVATAGVHTEHNQRQRRRSQAGMQLFCASPTPLIPCRNVELVVVQARAVERPRQEVTKAQLLVRVAACRLASKADKPPFTDDCQSEAFVA